MDKAKKSKLRLLKALLFSTGVTGVTLGIGLPVSIKIYKESEEKLKEDLKETEIIFKEFDNLAGTLNVSNEDLSFTEKDVAKFVHPFYHITYDGKKQNVGIYLNKDDIDNKKPYLELSRKNGFSREMRGNGAKTFITIIEAIIKQIKKEKSGQEDILLPFLKEIIKKQLDGLVTKNSLGGVLSKAKESIENVLVNQKDLFRYRELYGWKGYLRPGTDTDEATKIAKKYGYDKADYALLKDFKINSPIIEAILQFKNSFNIGKIKRIKSTVQKIIEKKNNDSSFIFPYMKMAKLINNEEELTLRIFKYNKSKIKNEFTRNGQSDSGWPLENMVKLGEAYITISEYLDNESIKKIKDEIKKLNDVKDPKNIFKRIAKDYENTIIAIARTYGYASKDEGVTDLGTGDSKTVRTKFIKFLKDENKKDIKESILASPETINWLTKTAKNISEIKDDGAAKKWLTPDSSKEIIIGSDIYQIFSINVYDIHSKKINEIEDKDKKISKVAVLPKKPNEVKWFVAKRNKGSKNKWDGVSIDAIDKEKATFIINLYDTTLTNGLDLTNTNVIDNLKLLVSSMLDGTIKNKANTVKLLNSLHKLMYWKVFSSNLKDEENFFLNIDNEYKFLRENEVVKYFYDIYDGGDIDDAKRHLIMLQELYNFLINENTSLKNISEHDKTKLKKILVISGIIAIEIKGIETISKRIYKGEGQSNWQAALPYSPMLKNVIDKYNGPFFIENKDGRTLDPALVKLIKIDLFEWKPGTDKYTWWFNVN